MNHGIIFIPDISGYSRFVKETDADQGATIVASLLEALIGANSLALEISEIEGDAILFYRHGRPYPMSVILKQFNDMLSAFDNAKQKFAQMYPAVTKLSLKLIVHYGSLAMYTVRGFAKLYGQAVVEAHRLLKNNAGADTYVLVTEEYMRQSGNSVHSANEGMACENYGDTGRLCYRLFH